MEKKDSFPKILLPFMLLVLSACSSDDGGPGQQTPVDPDAAHRPVLAPVGNSVIVIDQPFEITLSAEDPDGDEMKFSVNNVGIGRDTFYIRDNSSVFVEKTGTFTWTPVISQLIDFSIDDYNYHVEFIVKDSNGLSDSEIINIVVVESEIEKLYQVHCASCHGADAGGGWPAGAEVASPNLTGWIDPSLVAADIQLSMTDIPDMQDLDGVLTDVQLGQLAEYLNGLDPIP